MKSIRPVEAHAVCSLSRLAIRTFTPVFDGLWRRGLSTSSDSRKAPLTAPHPTDPRSLRGAAGVGDLRVFDTIKHESFTVENRSQARGIRIFVTGIGEQNIEIIVIRSPAPPIIISTRVRIRHAHQILDHRRAAVLG